MTDRLFDRLLGKSKELKISSYRLMRRSLVDRMVGMKSSFVYISALMILNSHQLVSIRSHQLERKHWQSNYSLMRLVRLYLNIWIHYGTLGRLGWIRRSGELYRVVEEK